MRPSCNAGRYAMCNNEVAWIISIPSLSGKGAGVLMHACTFHRKRFERDYKAKAQRAKLPELVCTEFQTGETTNGKSK